MSYKEFIPYEQAIELKKLGFSDKCLDHWYEKEDGTYELFKLVDVENANLIFPFVIISAPLFQQAFRWFREKHDLFGIVQGKGYNHKRYYIHTINGEWHPSQPTFDTPEDAELSCLNKLIELVKNK